MEISTIVFIRCSCQIRSCFGARLTKFVKHATEKEDSCEEEVPAFPNDICRLLPLTIGRTSVTLTIHVMVADKVGNFMRP